MTEKRNPFDGEIENIRAAAAAAEAEDAAKAKRTHPSGAPQWDDVKGRALGQAARRTSARRPKEEDNFAIVPLWAAAVAAEATRSPALLVLAYILHLTRKTGRRDCTLANGWLEKRGVSRQAKVRILRRFETCGLISVNWRQRKSPIITVHL
jgi:hypothetical protein